MIRHVTFGYLISWWALVYVHGDVYTCWVLPMYMTLCSRFTDYLCIRRCEINFCCLYMSLNDGPYTLLWNGSFLHLYADCV